MRTFAQKQKPTKEAKSTCGMRSVREISGQSREVRPILHLQRTIGNHAVQRLLQHSVKELEADSSGTVAATGFMHDFSQIPLYPKAHTKIQAKLMVSTPGDIYEQEADRIADQVMRQENIEKEHKLRTRKADNGRAKITRGLENRVNALNGKGKPLPESERQFFEPRFRVDFGKVHVHTGTEAALLSQSLNARAFTLRNDVIFGAHQYHPETKKGKRLLAHELTHVVQQNHLQPPEQKSAKNSTAIQVTNKPSHSTIDREFGEAHQIAEDVSFRFDPDTGIVEFTGEGTHDFLRAQLGRIGQSFHITELSRNLLFQIQMIIGWPLRGEPESIQMPSTYRSLLYNVPIIRQPAPWGCWAASFSMIYAWRYPNEIQIPDLADPEEVNDFLRLILRPYGEHWVDSFDQQIGLNDTNVSSFLNDTGLSGEIVSHPRSPEQWFRILSTYGPLMVGIAGHMLVVVGIAGNGVPEETVFFINNPSSGGVETTEPFSEFIDRFEALEAAGHEGVHIFHWP